MQSEATPSEHVQWDINSMPLSNEQRQLKALERIVELLELLVGANTSPSQEAKKSSQTREEQIAALASKSTQPLAKKGNWRNK
jgi:hypothetical protein